MAAEEGSNSLGDATLKAEILRSLQRRDRALSVSPSEIARSLADDRAWRPLIPRIRNLLVQLVREKRVIATRETQVLSAQEIVGGTIRIRRGPQFD